MSKHVGCVLGVAHLSCAPNLRITRPLYVKLGLVFCCSPGEKVDEATEKALRELKFVLNGAKVRDVVFSFFYEIVRGD